MAVHRARYVMYSATHADTLNGEYICIMLILMIAGLWAQTLQYAMIFIKEIWIGIERIAVMKQSDERTHNKITYWKYSCTHMCIVNSTGLNKTVKCVFALAGTYEYQPTFGFQKQEVM